MDLMEMLKSARALAAVDTNASIFRCRQFAETVTRALADESGTDIAGQPFFEQITAVGKATGLTPRVVRALHNVRILGNGAAHRHLDGDGEAESALALCEEILAATMGVITPEVAVELPLESPAEEVEPEAEEDLEPLFAAIQTLRDRAIKHDALGLKVPAVVSFEAIDPELFMQLTTSGYPRKGLDASIFDPLLHKARSPRNTELGVLGELGFRAAGPDSESILLIVPPTSAPQADLGLSPLGDAYLDALCSEPYLEGQMTRRHVLRHISAALVRAQIARLDHPEWPNHIYFGELGRATLAAFQWPYSQRQFMVSEREQNATVWKSLAQSTPGWSWPRTGRFAQLR